MGNEEPSTRQTMNSVDNTYRPRLPFFCIDLCFSPGPTPPLTFPVGALPHFPFLPVYHGPNMCLYVFRRRQDERVRRTSGNTHRLFGTEVT